jgi:hypothetical protein
LPDAARRAWDAAKQLAGANDYKGALVEFQRAYELSHDPRVLYNVGITEKLLTHYARAVDAWEREQREGANRLDATDVQDLRNAIGIVRQFVSTMDVTSSEADATLSIDDLPAGSTPFNGPVRIDVGRHVLKLSKTGFADATQTVDIAAGARAAVTFKLEPLSKTSLVSVTVGGAPSATVWVDGKDMGPAPFKGELTAERHTVEARAPGYVPVSETIDVAYRQPMSLVLSLSPERHEARLRVAAADGAEISLDQRVVGSGAWDGVVSSGSGHQLVVRLPGFQIFSTEVYLADDQVRDIRVTLNREVTTSWVAWGVGSLLVVTGGIVAGYFIFKPSQPGPYVGDLAPGLTPAAYRLRF